MDETDEPIREKTSNQLESAKSAKKQGNRLLLNSEYFITKVLPKGFVTCFAEVITEVIMMAMSKAESKRHLIGVY